MQNNSPESKWKLLRNTAWTFKLAFQHAPIISAARLLGYINGSANGLIRAYVIGILIDAMISYVNNPAEQGVIVYALTAFGLYYLFTAFADAARNYGNNLGNLKMGYELPRKMLYQKLNRLGSASLENPEVQNLITRYQENQYSINNMSWNAFNIIATLTSLVASLVPLFSIMPIVTILLIVASLPIFAINKSMIDQLWQIDKDTTVAERRGNATIGMLQDPSHLKEIKLLNAYDYLKKYFEEYIQKLWDRRGGLYSRWALYDFLSAAVTCIIILLGIYNLIQLSLVGTITVGSIAFFLSALTGIGSYIDAFSSNLASYLSFNNRLTELRRLLDWPEPQAESQEEIEKFTTPPHIELNNVSFKYPGAEKFVIEGLNLTIKPGEKIAIVGENGAGKTTLVKLLSNIYPVTSGQLHVNGKDLNSITAESWFKNLGVLYQDYNTYNDLSAFENIALGNINEEVSYEDVQEAARKADAYEFIMDYKDNFSQILSEKYEGGTRPSTGQWQKIAIARFFYRNAPILILDEPTASIDAVAEANIFNRIYSFIQHKTVIIISHRFATVRNADRIIVFDQGKIIEEGSHEELIQINGKYAHAFKLQAEGYN